MVIYSCAVNRISAGDPNFGNINISIDVVSGQDSLIRISNGTVIGKIDKNGNVWDITTNKIFGKRTLSDEELRRLTIY